MFKWQFARFVINGLLILGSGVFVVRSPGWNAALAQVGYYIKYGAATTLWLANNRWINNAGFKGLAFSNVFIDVVAADEFCKSLKKEYGNFHYRTPGPYLDVQCSPSGATTLWLVNNKWINGAGFSGPNRTNKFIVDAVAKAYTNLQKESLIRPLTQSD